jgi:predicted cobalt transporter CbtA
VTFVIYQHPSSVSILGWFFEALAIGAFIFEAYAFVDAIRRPAPAFTAAGKQTKPLWLIITGVATVIGLGTAATGSFPIGILAVAAFVAAAIYVTDVKPKVKDYRSSGGQGQHMGPYGPW